MLLSADRTEETKQQPLSIAIIDAIAEQEGTDPIAIEPPEYEALYDVLNPEALDALFAPKEDGTQRSVGRVEFTYCGYRIVVTSDGEVSVNE